MVPRDPSEPRHVRAGRGVRSTNVGRPGVRKSRSRSPSTTSSAGCVAEVDHHQQRRRGACVNTRRRLVGGARDRSEGRVGQRGQRAAQLGRAAGRPRAPARATRRSSSDQSSLERRKVAGSCGSGTSAGSQPICSNSREPALGRGRAELGLGVGGEELERRRGGPLLALEEHRRERAGQRQQRRAERAGPRRGAR